MQPLGRLDQPSGYMRTCQLEPISLEYLASSIEKKGYISEIFTGNITTEDIIHIIKKHKPFAIGFSVFTYTYEICLSLSKIAKLTAHKFGYKLITIFGGYHASAVPEEVVLNDEVDFVVIGEGEETLSDLLDSFNNSTKLSEIKGIAFNSKRGVINTGRRNRIKDINSLPPPKRSSNILKETRQYQIAYPPPSKQISVAQVMYSRGCVFNCSFCSSRSTWGTEVYWRSPSTVLDEIEQIIEYYGTNLIYFPDLTFNLNKKKVLNFCKEFTKRKPNVYWWSLFRLDLLDEEMLFALKEANCTKLSLGIENPDLKVAKKFKGSYYTNVNNNINILDVANKLGFILKAFLMIGLANETERMIYSYKDIISEYPIDELRVTFATPFPGTKLWDESFKNGRFNNPIWSELTTEIPILAHDNIDKENLVLARNKLVSDFYLDRKYFQHVTDKIKKHPHLKESWLEYFNFFELKGGFRGRLNEYNNLINVIKKG